MKLLAFPCDREIAANFLKRVEIGEAGALVLKKQMETLKPLIEKAGIKSIYVIDELLYGMVTSKATENILKTINACHFEEALFPVSNFLGNTLLLLASLTPKVTWINANSSEDYRHRFNISKIGSVKGKRAASHGNLVQKEVVQMLELFEKEMESHFVSSKNGERPTLGLINNIPYDVEVLARYFLSSEFAYGRVLEIGSGLGYGAYAMLRGKHIIKNITAIDYDMDTTGFASKLWRNESRLKFYQGSALSLPFEDESFDTVVMFELIEHIANPDRALVEARRVLRPGGLLVGSTPNYRLYPYRVNLAQRTDHAQLRREGIWPWHLSEFDDESIQVILKEVSLTLTEIMHVTYLGGLNYLKKITRLDFNHKLQLLSNLTWSVSDFGLTKKYIDGFSGHSFIFIAEKG